MHLWDRDGVAHEVTQASIGIVRNQFVLPPFSLQVQTKDIGKQVTLLCQFLQVRQIFRGQGPFQGLPLPLLPRAAGISRFLCTEHVLFTLGSGTWGNGETLPPSSRSQQQAPSIPETQTGPRASFPPTGQAGTLTGIPRTWGSRLPFQAVKASLPPGREAQMPANQAHSRRGLTCTGPKCPAASSLAETHAGSARVSPGK